MRFFLVLIMVALAAPACKSDSPTPTSPTPPRAEYSQTDLRVGTGAEAQNGRTVFVNYTGWLYDNTAPDGKGREFDTSIGRGVFSFLLGQRAVIAGWDRGLVGMRVGGL